MAWWGTGYSPPGHPPGPLLIPHPGYTPSSPARLDHAAVPHSRGVKEAVGLKSVDQLSLSAHFSGSGVMTEVYNLLKIGRIINHKYIPGNK